MPILKHFDQAGSKITYDTAYYAKLHPRAKQPRMHDVDFNALTTALSPTPFYGGMLIPGEISIDGYHPEYSMFLLPYKANRNLYSAQELKDKWILLYCPSGDMEDDGSAKVYQTTDAFISDLFSGRSSEVIRSQVDNKINSMSGFLNSGTLSTGFQQALGTNRSFGVNQNGYLTIDGKQPSITYLWHLLNEIGLEDLSYEETQVIYDEFLKLD